MPKTRTRKPTVTEVLAGSNNPSDWVTAARRKTCKLHTLEKIVEKAKAYKNSPKYSDMEKRSLSHLDFFICSNHNVSEEILESKVYEYSFHKLPHSQSYILDAILKNPNTTEKILGLLKTNRVLLHPSCPEKKMIEYLEKDSLAEVSMLALNPNLPLRIQRKLAESPIRKIRQKLSTNQFIDESIIDFLCDDPSPIVVRNLISHSKISSEKRELLTQKLKRIGRGRINKVTLARHSSDEEDLKEYIQDDDYSIAYYATKNENFSTEHAELGCGHKYKGIRNVSKNHEKCSETGKVIAALMD